jgi:outer membrane protein OmpA-like peptidoglycan-associated protein
MEEKRITPYTLALLILLLILQGCASSSITRNAATEMDGATQRFDDTFNSPDQNNAITAYQNASPVTKGLVVGGAAGALVGGMTAGVGVVPGAVVGAIGGGALGTYLQQHMTLIDQLENRNVSIITLGDQVLMVIPSELIFSDATATITVQGYSTLNVIADLLRGYTKMSVKVAAYASDAQEAPVAMAMTREQAQAIVKYLWSRDVNTRILYGVGYGSTHLVAKTVADVEGGPNYRIEITLEKLPT